MIYIVLPAFNEAPSIGSLLEEFEDIIQFKHLMLDIVVVDDGSTDGTKSVISQFLGKLPLTVLAHDQNRGLAEALKTGLLYSVQRSTDQDIIITMDADHSHPPGLIYRMIWLIKEGHDIVIASRYQAGARIRGLTFSRRMLSRIASLGFRVLFPVEGVRDYTCGYRAYRAGLLNKAFKDYGETFISQSGFSCMVDVLLRLRCYDPLATEVPLILRYDQKLGKSKMKIAKTIMETIELVVRRKKEDLIGWNRIMGRKNEEVCAERRS